MQQHKNNIMNNKWMPRFINCGYTLVSANTIGELAAGRDDSHMLLS